MTMKISKRHLCILGHVGKEPKQLSTPGGTAIVEFSVASSFSHKVDGKYVDDTEWTDCKMFGDCVETFMKYVGKGVRIEVEGHFRTEKYQKNGENRYKHYLIVDTYTPLSKKSDAQSSEVNASEGALDIPSE